MKTIVALLSLFLCNIVYAQEIDTLSPDTASIDEDHVFNENDTILPQRWEDILRRNLDSYTQKANQNNFNTGISIYDLTDSVLLYAYNQNKRLRPASTEKVLTAVTALDLLGAKHPYSTEIYADGNILTDTR